MPAIVVTDYTFPSLDILTGTAAAGGIAMINSVANIGGFLGPTLLGRYGLWSMAVVLLLGAVLVLGVHKESTEEDKGVDDDDEIAV